MHTEQGNTMLSLRTANDFVEQHQDVLPAVMTSGAKQRLAEILATLAEHASHQVGSTLAARGATQAQRALRTVLLRTHMAPIVRIAKVDLPTTPELKPLRMPRGRPTIERLAAAASGMAEAAAPHAAVFIRAGLPADFLAQLTEAADALVGSLNARLQRRGETKGATEGLKAKLSEGRKIVHVLDAFVQSELQDEPALLASWGLVMRVQKTRGRRQVEGPVPTPAPTGTTG
jgi:hypothetical protein